MGNGEIGATSGPPKVTAVDVASTTSNLGQAEGSQPLAQAAEQSPVTPMILNLKDLAHADAAVVRETIGLITGDLAQYVTRESGGTGNSSATAQRIVNEGIELQRSADFADQSQAKIWALRVLSWIGSVVTLGALPGLTKLLAPKSDFTDSLSRYLFGNGPDVDPTKLEKFQQLFEKFQEFHESLAGVDLASDDTNRIASNLSQGFINSKLVSERGRAVFKQVLPIYQEINHLIFNLGTLKEISGERMADAIAEKFNAGYGVGRKAASGNDPHFEIDWKTAITRDILTQADPEFPAACKFEVDVISRSDFRLCIGSKSITKEELEQGMTTNNERETATRRWILEAIQEITDDPDQQVNILRNLLSTCIGQATNADARLAFMEHASNDHESLDIAQPNSVFYNVTVDANGICSIRNTITYNQCASSPPDNPYAKTFIPCDIRMTMAYESSLEDFTSDQPPHVVRDQCTISGRYLDMSDMA